MGFMFSDEASEIPHALDALNACATVRVCSVFALVYHKCWQTFLLAMQCGLRPAHQITKKISHADSASTRLLW